MAAKITQRFDLAQQYRRRYPGRAGCGLAFAQVIRKRSQFGHAQLGALVPRPRIRFQMAAYSVHRASDRFGNLAQAHAMLPQ